MSMKVPFAAMFLILAGCSSGGSAGTTGGNPGATGAASERYMGVRSNVNATWTGATSSSTMLEQRIKEDSARGAASGGGDTKY
ncbi:MAG: hypothetical protein EPO10_26180 [Reyranella sp.]|uniref:hypothetical protein n=1 Tax=Reyranella sp. TaxID=1929291 RepID=UPI00120729C8|nr:hypothetical protein [Reyranella sp.]TAJ97403.1 MAG: hypothetical protein EPO41_03080 [Reyranella sp.]TBR23934.1 MAG: hypothetical protein EPO10_26180 [Reyranella sp.]